MERQFSIGLTNISAPTVMMCKCPLCNLEILPDVLGFLECSCGWGGPDDPLESTQGLSRAFMRLDRRVASAIARRELQIIAERKGPPAVDSILYTLILLLASTAIHLVMYGALIGLTALSAQLAVQHAWIGAILAALSAALFLAAVAHWRSNTRGIQFPREQLPRLDVALREVSSHIGGPLPHRIILVPGVQWAVFEHHPLRRFFLAERILIVGVGALPLMSIDEAKAVLAHELAHYRHAHTLLHRYISSAEAQARYIIDLMLEATGAQRRRIQRRSVFTVGSAQADLAAFLVWIVALPLACMWQAFHLLRLADSRNAEFRADAAATLAYGPSAFIGGLSAIGAARNMIYGGSVRTTIAMERGEASIYAEMRRHIAALPSDIIKNIRFKALYAYRSLENSHPAEPDRVRAALFVGKDISVTSSSNQPAIELITPQEPASTDEIEKKLTRLLFA